jgi:hypothetical protein
MEEASTAPEQSGAAAGVTGEQQQSSGGSSAHWAPSPAELGNAPNPMHEASHQRKMTAMAAEGQPATGMPSQQQQLQAAQDAQASHVAAIEQQNTRLSSLQQQQEDETVIMATAVEGEEEEGEEDDDEEEEEEDEDPRWTRYTCAGRTYFYHSGTGVYTLQAPAGADTDTAVAVAVVEEEEEDFARFFERASKMDNGELNARSQWIKFVCGAQAYYYHEQTKVYSLCPPTQGVRKEEQEEGEDEDEFADCYARALKEDQERASSSRVREQIAEIYAQHDVPLDVDMVMREHEQYYGQDKESELLQKVQQKYNHAALAQANVVHGGAAAAAIVQQRRQQQPVMVQVPPPGAVLQLRLPSGSVVNVEVLGDCAAPPDAATAAWMGASASMAGFLATLQLQEFEGYLATEGFSFVSDLLDAEPGELEALAGSAGMKVAQSRRFLKAVATRAAAAAAAAAAGGAAAAQAS